MQLCPRLLLHPSILTKEPTTRTQKARRTKKSRRKRNAKKERVHLNDVNCKKRATLEPKLSMMFPQQPDTRLSQANKAHTKATAFPFPRKTKHVRILITASILREHASRDAKRTTDKECAAFFHKALLEVEARAQAEKQCVSFPRVCTLRSLLKCPRGQQSVFDQAPGVLPVRRQTIEDIRY